MRVHIKSATKKCTLVAATLIVTAGNSLAATAPAIFNGLIAATCILTAGVTGVLTPNSTYSTLSSRNALGVSSVVSVVSTGLIGSPFGVSAIAPSSFSSGPADGNTSTTFTSTYSVTGGATASNVAGATVTPVGVGATVMTVDLDATKSSGNFSAGAYSAIVTVRCE